MKRRRQMRSRRKEEQLPLVIINEGVYYYYKTESSSPIRWDADCSNDQRSAKSEQALPRERSCDFISALAAFEL